MPKPQTSVVASSCRRATLGAFLRSHPVDNLDSAGVADHRIRWFRTGSTIMSRRALLSVCAFAVTLATLPAGPAGAAGWLEMNFYLSGPRYDGVLPPCDAPEALQRIARASTGRKTSTGIPISPSWASTGFARRRSALGAEHHPAPVLQRRGCGLGRPQARHPLFDRRGCRHDRSELGRDLVCGRAGSQLGLQPGLQDGAALSIFRQENAAPQRNPSGRIPAQPRDPNGVSLNCEPRLFPFCS